MKVLLHLLSEQALPNAIAASLIKPDRVICLDTGKYTEQAGRLQEVSGLPHECVGFAPYDLDANVATIRNLLQVHNADEVWINFTGGTKMMALAAVGLGVATQNCHCVYVDTVRRRLVAVDRALRSTTLTLGNLDLGVTDLITLAGENELQNPGIDDATPRWNACWAMHANFASRELTKQAAELRSRLQKQEQQTGQPPPPQGQMGTGKSKAEWDGANLTLAIYRDNPGTTETHTIQHADPLGWLAGGWREEYAEIVLRRSNAFREVRRNVRIEWSDSTRQVLPKGYDPAKNEVDVFALSDWRPVIIECKSAWYDAYTLHKLKFLRDHLCGSFGVAILATGSEPGESIVEKARDQGIHLISGAAWKNLAECIRVCCTAEQPQVFVQ